MDNIPLTDSAARQVADSTTVFDEHRQVQALAKKFESSDSYLPMVGNAATPKLSI